MPASRPLSLSVGYIAVLTGLAMVGLVIGFFHRAWSPPADFLED